MQIVCPSIDEYKRSLNGEMRQEQSERLAEHLQECETCVQAYLQIEREFQLAHFLKNSSERTNDTILNDLIGKLVSLSSTFAEAQTATPGASDATEDLHEMLTPAEQPGELGRLGGYRVLAVQGQGGMGVVFRAEDPRLEREIALKAMRPNIASTKTGRRRFLREAKKMAAVEHENVTPIYQAGEDRGVLFLAMPMLKGESLYQRLSREGRLDLREVLQIGRQIAEGLAAIHDRGLVHRDLKPSNVFLVETARPSGERECRVKILDFGLARDKEDAGLTHERAILGTPEYMSPEQSRGEEVDAQSDLFSLGCILYRMCTGNNAFSAPDVISTLRAVAEYHPAPPDSINSELPKQLSDLVLRLLAKERDLRPVWAREVVEALQAIEQSGHIPVVKKSKPLPAPKPASPERPTRRTFLSMLVRPRFLRAAAAVLLIGVGAFLLFLLIRDGEDGRYKNVIGSETGEAMNKHALVRHPVKFKGVKSWTIETIHPRAGFGWVGYSPDGKHIAVAAGGKIRIWDAGSGRLKSIVYGSGSIAWSPDGKLIAFHAESDGPVWLWDVEAGRMVDFISTQMHHLTWSPDSKRLVGHSGIFDRSGKLLHRLQINWRGGNSGIKKHDVAWSPDGRWLVITGDGQVQVWDSIKGEKQRELEAAQGAIWNIAFSPDGKRMAANVDDKSVCLWSFATGKIIRNDDHPGNAIGAVVWLSDNKTLAFGGAHWDADTGKRLLGGKRKLSVVAYSPDGKTAVTNAGKGGYHTLVQLWDVASGKARELTKTLPVFGIPAWSPDGKYLAARWSQDLLLLDGKMGTRVRSFAVGGSGKGLKPTWSNDNRYVSSGSQYVDLMTGKSSKFVHAGNLMSPDFKKTATLLGDGKLNIHDTQTGKLVHVLDAGARLKSYWSPDSTMIAMGAPGCKTQIWDAVAGKLLKKIDAEANGKGSIAWSRNGEYLAIGNAIYNARTFKLVTTLTAKSPFNVSWSPNGKILSCYGELWDVETGKRLRQMEWKQGLPSWSPDGKSAAYRRASSGIAVANPATGKIRAMIVPLSENKVITISGDGHYRGPDGVEKEIVYVVQTEQGLETLTPDRFNRDYGWTNLSEKVKLVD